MSEYQWSARFEELFQRCLQRYQSGDQDFTGYYSDDDQNFLDSIGYKPREFFDFVEDFSDYGDPSPGTALLVAAVRRSYLIEEMGGALSDKELQPSDLPDRGDTLAGIAWLPRILAKARGKLRGELHPDIMFGCGGDRNFLKQYDIPASEFLVAVWKAGDDDDAVVSFVKGE
ncbi:MAG: hypothetical protein AAF226_11675 [Verrucomicrobiota bacterium]